MEEIDILVIGAGVVGLAVACEIAEKNKTVLVLEKNKSFGQETSSRNSEVIHAGMYYPEGSLKATMCVEGRELLYEICEKNKIPQRKIGKLIVATEAEELQPLKDLFNQGRNNGVKGLRMLDRGELKNLEPNINAVYALFSEETGIIDSHRLMQYFYDHAKDSGALVAYNSEVTSIERISDGYKVTVVNDAEIANLKSRIIINCAGLDSDRIAKLAGIDIQKFKQELHYCKGQYFRVNGKKSGLINRLIYPVPKPKSVGLGIHATLDLTGSIRLGPDDQYLETRNRDYSVDASRRHDFYVSVREFLPFIEENDLVEDIAGIRPKLQEQGGDFRDFIIEDEKDKELPAFINLVGIESPGLTASAAIAKHVKGLIKNYY